MQDIVKMHANPVCDWLWLM